MSAPDPAATTASAKADTTYVVLAQVSRNPGKDAEGAYLLSADSGPGWQQVGEVTARSAEAAIKQYAESGKPTEQVLVAIPSRSFQPVRVKPTTVTTLTVEPA